MGYLWAKDEGNQFFKHVPHFCDFTRSSGTFSLKLQNTWNLCRICLRGIWKRLARVSLIFTELILTNCNTNCSTTVKYWENMAFFQKHSSPIHSETNSLLNHWSIDMYTVYFTSTTHLLTMVIVYPIELISRVYSSHQLKLQKQHKSRMDTRLSSQT